MKKSLKVLLLLCSIIIICPNLSAQKKVCIVDYFSGSSGVDDETVDRVRSLVFSSLQSVNRFELIDVDAQGAIEYEQLRRGSSNAIYDETARNGIMKQLGANLILRGKIISIDSENKTKKNSITDENVSYYEARMTYSLSVVDTEKGTTCASKTFSVSYNDYSSASYSKSTSRQEVIDGCYRMVTYDVPRFINENFRLFGEIAQIEFSKKRIQDCYITIGALAGIALGQEADILEVRIIAGKEAATPIGELRVTEVYDELSKCKVTRGDSKIKESYNAGNTLRVRTK